MGQNSNTTGVVFVQHGVGVYLMFNPVGLQIGTVHSSPHVLEEHSGENMFRKSQVSGILNRVHSQSSLSQRAFDSVHTANLSA